MRFCSVSHLLVSASVFLSLQDIFLLTDRFHFKSTSVFHGVFFLFTFCVLQMLYFQCSLHPQVHKWPFHRVLRKLRGAGERSRSSEWSKETRGGSGRISPQLSCPFLCQLVRDGDTSNLPALWWKQPLRLAPNLLQARKTLRQPPSQSLRQPAC